MKTIFFVHAEVRIYMRCDTRSCV